MRNWKLVLLISLIPLGVGLQLSGLIDLQQLLAFARALSGHWWLGLLLVLIQALLFTFALAGSSMLWVAAAIFEPLAATLIITAGTTLGGVCGYLFSGSLSEEWIHRVRESGVYRTLQRESGFLMLLALRVMPGFPHSVINYSSGMLKLRLSRFVLAAVIGTWIKTYVYAVLIFNATTADGFSHLTSFSSVWPLLALSLGILVVLFLKRWFQRR